MAAFVGREPELAVLAELCDKALTGTPQVALVQGPAGIGKTTLIDEFVRSARQDSGLTVIRAGGEETEELYTYGVLEQLVRSARAAPDDDGQVAAAVDALHDVLGKQRIADPVTAGSLLLDLLDRLNATGVLVVIDDAHWADRASLQALTFAIRRLVADRVLTVIAVRDNGLDNLPESLHRLLGRLDNTVLRVAGMDEADLRTMAGTMGFLDVDAVAVRRLREGTQGNPLHARALLEEFPLSRWQGSDELLPPPRSFRRLVQDRYRACTEPARNLIDAAAVLGPNCALIQAAVLAGVDDPVPALAEAVDRDVLQVTKAAAYWTLAFSHPLIRSAVYDAIGPARRQAWHLAAVDLVDDEAAALRHRVAAAAAPDEVLAADLSRFAARLARRLDWQGAANHLITSGRLSPDPEAAQRRVMRAVIWTTLRGDAATARGFAAEIAAYAAGPLRDLVLGSLAMSSDDPVTAGRLLQDAWEAIQPGTDSGRTGGTESDGDLAALIALTLGIHSYGRLDAAATVSWCATALETTSHPSIRSMAQTYLVHGLAYAGRTDDSYAAAESAQQRPDQPDHPWMNPRSARGVLRLVDDDLVGARADLESAAVSASRLGILNTAAFSYAYLARAEWVTGLWDDAMVHAERAVAINIESGVGFMESAVTGIAVLVPAARGDWAVAEEYIRSMSANDVGYERSAVALGMARARVGEARGRPEAVLTALEPAQRFSARDGVQEPGFWIWQDLYADALVSTGRIAEADAFLAPHERAAAERGRRTMIARLARSRGRLHGAAGRIDDALAAFDRARQSLGDLVAPFERARIEFASGAVLRRAGQRRRAAEQLERARQLFADLGATPYAQRCDTELAASGLAGRSQLAARERAGLTAQELVVARLAAGGSSNRDIADELVVSIKTVEYHLRNVFTKLGVASRHQLAARLAEVGAA